MVRVFNDRGTYVCKAVTSERARPGVVNGLGVWWRKLGAAGTNVNELTHQRLTDIGRAPSFYDCLVEVGTGRQPGTVTRAGPAATLRSATRVAAAAALALLISGCGSIGYYAQSIRGHLALVDSARPVTEWLAAADTPPALKERLRLTQRIRDFAVAELEGARQRRATAAMPT